MQRRRTQIRLAQRAYRQRKETTIAGLNRRVTSLENTIEEMHKNFRAFNDRAIASGMWKSDPVLAQHLKTTAELLAGLAKNSAHDSIAEEEELERDLSSQPTEIERQRSTSRRTTTFSSPAQISAFGYQTTYEEAVNHSINTAQQVPATQTEMGNLPLSDWNPTETMQQYQAEVPATDEATSHPLEEAQQCSVPAPNPRKLQGLGTNDVVQYNTWVSEQSAMQGYLASNAMSSSSETTFETHAPSGRTLSNVISLPNPKSYASQEASFARRLMRSSLEEGYRLMTNPNTNPEEIRRRCRFSLCFTDSSRIVHRMKTMLERTATQNLELWNVPQYHLGGAGLHYPRVGIDSAGVPPEWWAKQAPIGPLPPPTPDNPMPNSRIEDIVERVEYGGEWFDSNDVEQYLRSRGLYLDGQSSIVEVTGEESITALNDSQVPSATSPAASSSNESPGGPHSPRDTDSSLPNEAFVQGAEFPWNGDFADISGPPDANMDLPWGDSNYLSQKPLSPNLGFNMFSDTMPTFNTKMKKFVDVEKFVESTFLILSIYSMES